MTTSINGYLPSSLVLRQNKVTKKNSSHIVEDIGAFSHINEYSDLKTAMNFSKAGEVLKIENRLYYFDGNKFTRIKMDEKTFLKLFSKPNCMDFKQGNAGDCYLLVTLYGFLNNPKSRGKIYEMFEQRGEDVIVTMPDKKESPILYKNKKIPHKTKDFASACLGIQMIEDAYSKTRMQRYKHEGLHNIECGSCANVMNTFIGKKASVQMTDLPDMTFDEYLSSVKRVRKDLRKSLADFKKCKELLSFPCRLPYKDKKALNKEKKILYNEIKINFSAYISSVERLDANNKNYKPIEHGTALQRLECVRKYGNDDDFIVCTTSSNAENIGLLDGHAYYVSGVEEDRKIVNLVDPYNTKKTFEVDFRLFMKCFDQVHYLDLNKA